MEAFAWQSRLGRSYTTKSTVGAGLRDAASARMPDAVEVFEPPLILAFTSSQYAEATFCISFKFPHAVGSVQEAILDASSLSNDGFT